MNDCNIVKIFEVNVDQFHGFFLLSNLKKISNTEPLHKISFYKVKLDPDPH